MGNDNYCSSTRYRPSDDSGYVQTDRGSSGGFSFSDEADRAMSGTTVCADLLPTKDGRPRIIDCFHEIATTIYIDGSASTGDATKVVLDKLKTFFRRSKKLKNMKDIALSFGIVGDARDGDKHPFQITNFSQSSELYNFIEKFVIERGGGGGGKETYEMSILNYLLHYTFTDKCKISFLFIVGDEMFYEDLDLALVKKHFEIDIDPISAEEVIKKVCEKSRTFFICFKQSDEQTKRKNIDEEIAKRLREAGAKSGIVRGSLLWNTRDDLDLHCQCPCGTHIYYGYKKCEKCGGHLDVDMNVRGETLKPVENIHFPEGTARVGSYKFWVQNYAYHSLQPDDPGYTHQNRGYISEIPFKVEIEINGEIEHFENVTHGTGQGSDVLIKQFDYMGKPEPQAENSGAISGRTIYDDYETDHVVKAWRKVLGPRVLVLEDPNVIMDLILGAMAMECGGNQLQEFLDDITNGPGNKGLNEKRAKALGKALRPFCESLVRVQVSGELPKSEKDEKKDQLVHARPAPKKSKRR